MSISAYYKLLLLCLLLVVPSDAFSQQQQPEGVSRRDAWKVGFGVVGGVVYGKILGDVLFRVSRGMAFPDDHERRVARTIQEAAITAAAGAGDSKTLRILEIGKGSDCRLIRRGLYEDALAKLADIGITQVELVGIDVETPSEKVIQQAKDYLNNNNNSPIQVDLTVLKGDFTDSSSFAATAAPFDVAISCLTLCSVVDPEIAVTRIRDLIRPNGGCLGYIEHVAVDAEQEPSYGFLEWQQEQLDPLQQAVAHNCHLHRYTEQTIDSVFGVGSRNSATRISQERFLVDSMWPVSCQACGVIQRRNHA
jgi:SAM-dependent methyltransferase